MNEIFEKLELTDEELAEELEYLSLWACAHVHEIPLLMPEILHESGIRLRGGDNK